MHLPDGMSPFKYFLCLLYKKIKKENGGPEKEKKMLRAISTGKKNIDKRRGAPTTRGGPRPGGASEPRPTRLASTDTATGSSDDGDSPKSGLTNKGPTMLPVALYVVAKNGVVPGEHTGDTSLAGKLLDPIGYKVDWNVDMRDVSNLATTLNDDRRKVCVLVDVDSYTGGGIVKDLTAALPLIKREYMLIIKSTDSGIMSDLEQINEYAVDTWSTPIDVNGIIRMEPRCVVIVHDSSSNPEDVWKLAYKDDASFYILVGIECGDIKDAVSFHRVVALIEHAFKNDPRPCKVIFQCANVGRFLVELHSTFLRFADKTRVLSLVHDANRSTGYAYNLYGHADAPGAKVATGPKPRYELVEHKPLKLMTDENSNVIVISKAGPSQINDPDGIYDENGAARTIRDARAAHKDTSGNAAPIAGGFKIHLTTVGSFPDIQTNFLVYADSGVTGKVETATSKIKGLYRLLVMPLSEHETEVGIHGKRIETGKIIQMYPSAAPLQPAAPVHATKPGPVPSASASADYSALLGSTHAEHAAAPQPQQAHAALVARMPTTMVVTLTSPGDAYMNRLVEYANAKYRSHAETFMTCTWATLVKEGLLPQYIKLVFWFTGDQTELSPIYNTLAAVCARARTRQESLTIHLVYTATTSYRGTMPVPYHMYREASRKAEAGAVTIELAILPRSATNHTAIVVKPSKAAQANDAMIVGMMVCRLQDKLKSGTEITLVELEAHEQNRLYGEVTRAVKETKRMCCVLLLDEDDTSLDVLDAINTDEGNAGNYKLFVVSGDQYDRQDRKDTKLSGWVRDGVGIDKRLDSMPRQNEILRLITNSERRAYALDASNIEPVAYVVTSSSKVVTPHAFAKTYDTGGKLRKLICGGKTHAFVYNTKTAKQIVLPQLNQKAVLVIAAMYSSLIEVQSLDKLNCRVLINSRPKTEAGATTNDNQKLIDQIIETKRYNMGIAHEGIAQEGTIITKYVELIPKVQHAFGMMSEFV